MEKEIYLGKFFDQKLILKVDDEVDNEVDWTEEDWRKQWTNYLENGYKWNGDLDIDNNNSYCSDCSRCYGCSRCSDCSYCSDCSRCYDCYCCYGCSYCSNCSDCYDCSYCYDCSDCRELKNGEKHQYKICNVQFTKEEYENKIKELRK